MDPVRAARRWRPRRSAGRVGHRQLLRGARGRGAGGTRDPSPGPRIRQWTPRGPQRRLVAFALRRIARDRRGLDHPERSAVHGCRGDASRVRLPARREALDAIALPGAGTAVRLRRQPRAVARCPLLRRVRQARPRHHAGRGRQAGRRGVRGDVEALPRHQRRAAHTPRLAAGRRGWQRPIDALAAGGRRGVRAAHRLCERRQPHADAGRRPRTRDPDSCGGRGVQLPPGAPVPGREPAARPGGGSLGGDARRVGSGCPRGARAAGRAAPRGRADRPAGYSGSRCWWRCWRACLPGRHRPCTSGAAGGPGTPPWGLARASSGLGGRWS